jgi:hypothetical protein
MDELRENEQYFFDEETIVHLANFARVYANPCCLCAPTVGRELERLGFKVRTLDLDDRFKVLEGFLHYNLSCPNWLGEDFGIILFDPPFFNATPVSMLVDAVRMLARYTSGQKLLISWPIRRSKTLLEGFSEFDLVATGYHPGYVTVANNGKNAIEFYGNLEEGEHQRLARK